MYYKKDVLTNFANFTAKQLSWGFLFNKVAELEPANLLKNKFPMNFVAFLRITNIHYVKQFQMTFL